MELGDGGWSWAEVEHGLVTPEQIMNIYRKTCFVFSVFVKKLIGEIDV